MDRNVDITGYFVRYSLTSDPENKEGNLLSDRMSTVSGLIPRTNYTFDVAAYNLGSQLLVGSLAAETVVTAISPGN